MEELNFSVQKEFKRKKTLLFNMKPFSRPKKSAWEMENYAKKGEGGRVAAKCVHFGLPVKQEYKVTFCFVLNRILEFWIKSKKKDMLFLLSCDVKKKQPELKFSQKYGAKTDFFLMTYCVIYTKCFSKNKFPSFSGFQGICT